MKHMCTQRGEENREETRNLMSMHNVLMYIHMLIYFFISLHDITSFNPHFTGKKIKISIWLKSVWHFSHMNFWLIYFSFFEVSDQYFSLLELVWRVNVVNSRCKIFYQKMAIVFGNCLTYCLMGNQSSKNSRE